ncbi:MAG TPA: hypothetical protein VFQ53_24000 [Kofleriaceae bacterium]|nr:hypothetical protein [Kofleriaceae bacterium]
MDRKLVSFVCVLGAAGCMVNGKPLFGLGGARSTASSAAPTADAAMPAVAAGPAPSSYAWCSGVKPADDASTAYALQTQYPEVALGSIAAMLCHPDDKAGAQRDAIEAQRQAWMKRLGMTEQDWATDVVAFANIRHTDRISLAVQPPKQVAWSKLDPIDQYAMLAKTTGDSAAFIVQPGAKEYLADALALTETGRVGYLEYCLHSDNPVQWAVCQPDIDALDVGKLGGELRALKRPAEDKMVVRVALAELQTKLVTHAGEVKAAVAKDDAYGKLFELARAARTEWTQQREGRRELLALVSELDDARATGSRKAGAGCSERAWPAFQRAIAALGGKAFDGVHGDREMARSFLDNAVGIVMRDPAGYLAANALASCESDSDLVTRALLDATQTWPGYRGPRTSAVSKIWLAGIELDQRGARLDMIDTKLPLGFRDRQPLAFDGYADDVVASVKDEGDSVRLTFAKASELQSKCTSWIKTNRIARIRPDGTLEYETRCAQWIKQRVDTTSRPIAIAKRYAAGLRPGVFVMASSGIVEAVWTKPDAAQPIAAFGVALK